MDESHPHVFKYWFFVLAAMGKTPIWSASHPWTTSLQDVTFVDLNLSNIFFTLAATDLILSDGLRTRIYSWGMTYPAIEAVVGLNHQHSCWMCWCRQNVSPNWGRVVWQRAHEDTWSWAADVRGSTPLAPAGLILSTDARPALRRQHYRSDLCRPLSHRFHQGSTGLEGVNTFTAVKAHSRGRC